LISSFPSCKVTKPRLLASFFLFFLLFSFSLNEFRREGKAAGFHPPPGQLHQILEIQLMYLFPPSWVSLSFCLNKTFFQWNVRVSRRDGTFATITCHFDTTAGELCMILGKKFFVKRDDSYQLYLKKGNFGLLPSD